MRLARVVPLAPAGLTLGLAGTDSRDDVWKRVGVGGDRCDGLLPQRLDRWGRRP